MDVSRRQFISRAAAAAGALALPTIIPASALGKGSKVAPSERITLGFVGVGGRGSWLADAFGGMKDVQIVAACDVDQGHLDGEINAMEGRSGKGSVKGYHDFRDLVSRRDLDGVVCATPDHWHALVSLAALRAGKNVYCEKPLANSIVESRAIANAVKATGLAFQVGSHERSTDSCRFAAELVRNGRIGKLLRVRINLPFDDAHLQQARAFKKMPEEMPIPSGFDYDFWLGHTSRVPYTVKRCHFFWRFNLAYGGGEMTDRGAHVMDIGQLGAGCDNTSPVHIWAKGVQNINSLYNTLWDYHFKLTYANGIEFIGGTDSPRGLKFEGTKGSIFVAIHGGALTANPASLLSETIGPNEIHLGRSQGHQRNWIEAIRDGGPTMAPAEAGHRTATLCHLANIAMRVHRPLNYDPVNEKILGDSEASALMKPYMRAPWHLEA